jgi:hypothetical protein
MPYTFRSSSYFCLGSGSASSRVYESVESLSSERSKYFHPIHTHVPPKHITTTSSYNRRRDTRRSSMSLILSHKILARLASHQRTRETSHQQRLSVSTKSLRPRRRNRHGFIWNCIYIHVCVCEYSSRERERERERTEYIDTFPLRKISVFLGGGVCFGASERWCCE